MQVCKYAKMQVYSNAIITLTSMQLCNSACMQVCKMASSQLCKYACKYASIQVDKYDALISETCYMKFSYLRHTIRIYSETCDTKIAISCKKIDTFRDYSVTSNFFGMSLIHF